MSRQASWCSVPSMSIAGCLPRFRIFNSLSPELFLLICTKGFSAAKNDGSWKDNFALYPRLLVRLTQLLMIELSAPAYGRADLVWGIHSGLLEACQAGLARGTFPFPESTGCDGHQNVRRGKILTINRRALGNIGGAEDVRVGLG